jgi:UDPglucose 6-dehydrogenase
MTAPTIGYAGMTHLGLNSAVAAAERGFATVCFDPDRALIRRLAAGELPVIEPDLPQLRARNAARLSFAADVAALARCDVVYIAPDVPTDDEGRSDLAGIDALLRTVRGGMRPDATLVVLSQVPPGFTRARQEPGLQLFYQVETLIFGRAIERALHPERFIVGAPEPARPLPTGFKAYLDAFGCPVLVMRLESAELAKIAINCCLVSSISVANTLAELCEGIGAAWHEIAPALKLDRRIGPHAYLTPGLGIAGGNLERDLATVCRIAEAIGSDAGVVKAWIANSRHRRDWAWRTLARAVLPGLPDPAIAVLGLAYKENTHSTKNAPAFAFIRHLGRFAVTVYDPVVPAADAPHPAARGAGSALAACVGADVLAIMTPWPEFKALDPAAIARAMRGRVVLDPYAVLDAGACAAAGLQRYTLGVGAG